MGLVYASTSFNGTKTSNVTFISDANFNVPPRSLFQVQCHTHFFFFFNFLYFYKLFL